jgi:hypothetical protein
MPRPERGRARESAKLLLRCDRLVAMMEKVRDLPLQTIFRGKIRDITDVACAQAARVRSANNIRRGLREILSRQRASRLKVH